MKSTYTIAVLAAAAFMLSACASQMENDIAALRTQHARERERLDEIRRSIVEAEQAALHARDRAVFERCRSTVARVHADIAQRRVQCSEELARFSHCVATKERQKGDTSFWGCLIGIGLGIASGGAALPLSMGGCAVGRLIGHDASACGAIPVCATATTAFRSDALAQNGMREMPICGGYLGLFAADIVETIDQAMRVAEVGRGTTADGLGLRVGDVIVRVQQEIIRAPGEFTRVLSSIAPGENIEVTVLRDGLAVSLSGIAKAVEVTGRAADRTKLGIRNESVHDIRFVSGVSVTAVESTGPAARAGVVAGDRFRRIGGGSVPTYFAVIDALNDVVPGAPVELVLQRGEVLLTVTATTSNRIAAQKL